jgi:hypothetical protein
MAAGCCAWGSGLLCLQQLRTEVDLGCWFVVQLVSSLAATDGWLALLFETAATSQGLSLLGSNILGRDGQGYSECSWLHSKFRKGVQV